MGRLQLGKTESNSATAGAPALPVSSFSSEPHCNCKRAGSWGRGWKLKNVRNKTTSLVLPVAANLEAGFSLTNCSGVCKVKCGQPAGNGREW